MGNPLPSLIAEIYMYCLEFKKTLFYKNPLGTPAFSWHKYVDEMLFVWIGNTDIINDFHSLKERCPCVDSM